MLSLPNLSSNTLSVSTFSKLALFICNLFIDGKFRTVNILYDPNIFNDYLLIHVDIICPNPILWQKIDITKPTSVRSDPMQRTDNTLQLIFFDPTHLPEEIDQFNEHFTFYRIFVFAAIDETQVIEPFSIVNELEGGLGSNSDHVLQYSERFGIR